MMDTTMKEQQQQINVVDDATLQAVLSSMSEPEMQAFLDELNKTGKACKLILRLSDPSNEQKLDLPGIGQTIELLTVPVLSEAPSTTSTITVLPPSQTSAEILLQELKSLIQQPPADIVPINIEQKLIPQPMETKSGIHFNTYGSRQTRTANTYGGTPVTGGNRPGTAVKSTITPSGSAIIRKPSQPQQTNNDDRMFFGRPTTIGQGQYHNRTGLMSNKQAIAPSALGQQRRITTSGGLEHHQPSTQRRPLSWFQ